MGKKTDLDFSHKVKKKKNQKHICCAGSHVPKRKNKNKDHVKKTVATMGSVVHDL